MKTTHLVNIRLGNSPDAETKLYIVCLSSQNPIGKLSTNCNSHHYYWQYKIIAMYHLHIIDMPYRGIWLEANLVDTPNLVMLVELLFHHSFCDEKKLADSWHNQNAFPDVLHAFNSIVLLDLLLHSIWVTQDVIVRSEGLIYHLCRQWWQVRQTPQKIKHLKK